MKRQLRPGIMAAATFAACLSLAGCQQEAKPTVTLDEARRIQAEFQGQAAFVVPPRTISDITAILDEYKPDEAKLAEARQTADGEPPPDLTPSQLVEFLYARGQAAGEIGRRSQQLADAREAVRLAVEAKHPQLNRIQQFLGGAAFEMGNYRLRAEIEELRVTSSINPAQRLSSLTAYAGALAFVGRLDEARRRIDEAERTFANPAFSNNPALTATRQIFISRFASVKMLVAGIEGRYDESEKHARDALTAVIRWGESPEARRQTAVSGVQGDIFERTLVRSYYILARSQMNLGKLVEAESQARKSLIEALKAYGRYSPVAAGPILLLAQIVYEQGRYTEAGTLADIAIDIYRSLGAKQGSVNLAGGLALRGRVQAIAGDTAAALASFSEARDLFSDDETLRTRYVESDPSYGATMLMAGQAASAVAFFEKMAAVKRAQFGERNYLTAEARGYLGAALAKVGNVDRALTEFGAAVPLLLQTSRQSNDETSAADRDRRLQQILEAYIDLLSRLRPGVRAGLDPSAEAFRIADAARARGVQRALAESAARTNIRDPDLAALVRQEQDARKQVSALFGLLANILNSPPEEQDETATRQLRERIDKLRDARAALRGEIERRFPDYANLIDPRPATVAEVQAMLRPGEAMLSTYVGAEKSFVWAVPKQGPVSFAAVAMGDKDMAQAVAHLRRALDPDAATLGDVPAFDVAAAHQLYVKIVQPVAAGLAGADSLLVVPDKALGQLPFGLLVTQTVANVDDGTGALFSGYKRVPFLVRQMALTQLPSVSALGSLRRVPVGNPSRKAFAGFGDPLFGPDQVRATQAAGQTQVAALTTRGLPLKRRNAPKTVGIDSAELAMLPRLPDTADEVRSVAAALKADPATDVFLGADATERQVKTLNLADRKVVMFATHGLIPGDLNGLTQPALALSAPTVAGTDSDGLLTMEEILGLRLDADWIVLSACNTAAGDGAGAEAASGLGLAFFYAGTRAVLLTNWPVETTSARQMTTDLFRRQAADQTLGRTRAMQQAMTAMIDGDGYVDQGKTVFSYAHPIFWAPFSVVGDGGGGVPGS